MNYLTVIGVLLGLAAVAMTVALLAVWAITGDLFSGAVAAAVGALLTGVFGRPLAERIVAREDESSR